MTEANSESQKLCPQNAAVNDERQYEQDGQMN